MILFSQSFSMKSSKVNDVTAQSFWAVTCSPKVAEIHREVLRLTEEIRASEEGDAKDSLEKQKRAVKAKLPGFIPHAQMSGGRSRKNVLHVSGMVMIDIDHCADMEDKIEMLKSRIKELGIVYIGISISGDGIRVFFLCPEGMTIGQAQVWFCEQTGVEHDAQCTDIARFSYAVPKENIIYIDEETLFGGDIIQPWCDDANVMDQKSAIVCAPSEKSVFDTKKEGVADSVARSARVQELLGIQYDETQTVNGVKCQVLFDQYFMKVWGKLPGPGDRHNKIGKAVMQMAPVFGSDPKRMMASIPRYGMSEKELADLIVDKLNWTDNNVNYAGPATKVEGIIQNIFKENRDIWDTSPYPSIEEAERSWDYLPRQPKWVNVWLSIVPKCVKFAAFLAATPGEMALADRVQCKLGNFRPTDLAASTVVMGFSGGFKGAAMAPAEELMKVLKKDTDAELVKENEYLARKEMAKNKKGKDAIVPNEVFNIRYLPNDTTKNRHIECLKCGHTTYTESAELSALVDSMKRASYDRKSFLLLCFDRSPVGSQTKAGTGGVNDTLPCKWNYMCGANLTSLYKAYPETTLTTGEVFRLTIACVPNTFGRQSEMYVGEYSQDQKELIQHVGELLMKCEGKTLTPKLSKAIQEWHKRKEQELKEEKDFDRLMLLGRIPLISYRIGQVIHLSWGIQSILNEEKKSGENLDLAAIDVSKFSEHKETVDTTLIVAENLFDTVCRFFYKRLRARNQYEMELVSLAGNEKGNDFLCELPDGPFTYEMLSDTVWKGVPECNIRQRIKRLVKERKVQKVGVKNRKAIFEKI